MSGEFTPRAGEGDRAPASIDAIQESMGLPPGSFEPGEPRFEPNRGLRIPAGTLLPDGSRTQADFITGALVFSTSKDVEAIHAYGGDGLFEVYVGVGGGQDIDSPNTDINMLGAWFLDREHGRDDLFELIRHEFQSQQAIEGLTTTIQDAVEAALAEAMAQASQVNTFDYGTTFGRVPESVICDKIGIPAGDRHRVRRWLEQADSAENWVPPASVQTEQDKAEEREFYMQLLADRQDVWEMEAIQYPHNRAEHPQDFIDVLVRAMQNDYIVAGRPLRERPWLAAAQLRMLVAAGLDTTKELMGNLLEAYSPPAGTGSRRVIDELAADPSLIPGAIDEAGRRYPPYTRSIAFLTEPLTISGVTYPQRTVVEGLITAANNDLAAGSYTSHAFASGARHCLGEGFAKAEITAALRVIGERFRGLYVASPGVRKDALVNTILPGSLRLGFNAS